MPGPTAAKFETYTRGAFRWIRAREPLVLISVLIVVAGLWAFVEIADWVVEGDSHAIDEMVLRSLRRPDQPELLRGPAWFAEAARDVTSLGGTSVLVIFTAAITGYLWLDRRRHAAMFLLAAVVSGALASWGLKSLFDRPRPDVVGPLAEVFTSSFPSSHSMVSAVVYLTLGAQLAASLPRRRLKVYVVTVGLVLAILIGLTRIFLGVHYPTDVLAGWAAGLVWAQLCWLAAKMLQSRGQIEPAAPPGETPAAD